MLQRMGLAGWFLLRKAISENKRACMTRRSKHLHLRLTFEEVCRKLLLIGKAVLCEPQSKNKGLRKFKINNYCRGSCGYQSNLVLNTAGKSALLVNHKHLPCHDSSKNIVLAVVSSCATCLDCVVTKWSNFSACSVTIGAGTRMRRRQVLQLPEGAGQKCPELNQTVPCNSENCGKYKVDTRMTQLKRAKKLDAT